MLYLRLTGWWSLGGTGLLSLYVELILIGVMAVYVVVLLQLRKACEKIQNETRKQKEKHESAQS
jgi:hypothetical protein